LCACAQVCQGPECKSKLSEGCSRLLGCGHWCGGVAGETECLPCLHVSDLPLHLPLAHLRGPWLLCSSLHVITASMLVTPLQSCASLLRLFVLVPIFISPFSSSSPSSFHVSLILFFFFFIPSLSFSFLPLLLFLFFLVLLLSLLLLAGVDWVQSLLQN